jgi:uncharacterized damage-inducible protein DinB
MGRTHCRIAVSPGSRDFNCPALRLFITIQRKRGGAYDYQRSQRIVQLLLLGFRADVQRGGDLDGGSTCSTCRGGFPSINATLAHIVGAEWLWLRRWQGKSPTSAPAWEGKPTLTELKVYLHAVEEERASFISMLTDADLDRVVSYRGGDGRPFAHPLGQLIQHVVNHSTYHRGQLATQLHRLGTTPPNTNFTRYLREWR